MPDDTIWIQSTRDPGREHMCEITWGPLQFYATVADVRTTALDLVTCAAYAEMMMKLAGLGVPAATVSAFTTDLLFAAAGIRRFPPRIFGTPTTLELMPAGSTKRRQPLVLLKRGKLDGALTPDEARAMSLRWFEVAEATESDCLVVRALQLTGRDDAAEELFAALRKLREVPGA